MDSDEIKIDVESRLMENVIIIAQTIWGND